MSIITPKKSALKDIPALYVTENKKSQVILDEYKKEGNEPQKLDELYQMYLKLKEKFE